jgi:uncharacterized protein (TIGR03118 family)
LFSASSYAQTNLVSDIPGMAQTTDANLKNPWGVSFTATSPFWVSNQVTNTATLYSGTGSTIAPIIVSIPSGPTGQVNNTSAGFLGANGSPASFIFATLGGGIYAWNGGNGTGPNPPAPATPEGTVPGAVFTGLAQAGNFLYAANGAGAGGINVFNSLWAPTTLAGSFTTPGLPAGYVPYNIQNVGGQLYVEYTNGSNGAVSIFDTNGNFVKQLIAPGGSHLDEPWGVVIAPSGFGSFANDLLVGNEGNGEINAFDPTTGAFLGTLTGTDGNPIVNGALWALAVRTGGTFDTTAVYLTAGINDEQDGLFAKLNAVPEPFSIGLSALGFLAVGFAAARRRRTRLN